MPTPIRQAPKLQAKDPAEFNQKAFEKAMDEIASEYGDDMTEWHPGGSMTRPTREGALRVLEESIKGAQYFASRAQQALTKLNALKRTLG